MASDRTEVREHPSSTGLLRYSIARHSISLNHPCIDIHADPPLSLPVHVALGGGGRPSIRIVLTQ